MLVLRDKRFNRGHVIDSEELNRVADLASRLERVTGGGSVSVDTSGISIQRQHSQRIRVRITDRSPAGDGDPPGWYYSWIAVIDMAEAVDDTSSDYPAPRYVQDNNGPSGTYNGPCPLIESNKNADVPYTIDDVDGPVIEALMADDNQTLRFTWPTTTLPDDVSIVNLHITGDLIVDGDTDLDGDLDVEGSTTLNGPVYNPATGSPTDLTLTSYSALALLAAPVMFLRVFDLAPDEPDDLVIVDINSLAIGLNGRRIVLVNRGPRTLRIIHESATELTNGRRIITPHGQHLLWPADHAVEFSYDPDAMLGEGRWRVWFISYIFNPGRAARTIAANVNNLKTDKSKPTVELFSSAPYTIHGIDAPKVVGYIHHLLNTGDETLTIPNLSVLADAGNKVVGVNGADFLLKGGCGASIIYTSDNVWRFLLTPLPIPLTGGAYEVLYFDADGNPTSSPIFKINQTDGQLDIVVSGSQVVIQPVQANSSGTGFTIRSYTGRGTVGSFAAVAVDDVVFSAEINAYISGVTSVTSSRVQTVITNVNGEADLVVSMYQSGIGLTEAVRFKSDGHVVFRNHSGTPTSLAGFDDDDQLVDMPSADITGILGFDKDYVDAGDAAAAASGGAAGAAAAGALVGALTIVLTGAFDYLTLPGSGFLTIEMHAIDLTTDVTGVLPVPNGGTGNAALTDGAIVLGNSTSALTVVTPGSNGQVLFQGGSEPAWTTITGDVTVSPTGVTAIGSHIVQFAQIQQITGPVFLGKSSGTGDIASMSVSIAQGLLGTTGINTGDQINVTGNAGTVTVADAGGDTTTWLMLATSQTGNLSPATDSGLIYNATTHALTATTFVGALMGNAATATALANARTIGGVSFNGTANITVASATSGFTVSGGALAVGTNDITCTGSLGATAARLTKGWFVDLQVTNAIAGSVTGNAATATALANARTINGTSFDGTSNITVTAAAGTLTGSTLASGVTASSLTSVGTLVGGATGTGFTVSFGSSTFTGNIPIGNVPTGSSASTVCIGNDSRLSDSRAPSGSAGGDLAGTYPNPTVTWIGNQSGQSVLGSAFTLTQANGTFEDTGLSITLPAAGTYAIWYNVRGVISFSVGSSALIACELYNSTDAAAVTDSQRLVVYYNVTGASWANSIGANALVTVAASKTIKLYAKRDSATTWTTSVIQSDTTNGRTAMGYVRIY